MCRRKASNTTPNAITSRTGSRPGRNSGWRTSCVPGRCRISLVRGLREDLIASLGEYRRLQQRGLITDFTKDSFDPEKSFARIGGGSLGGKARGLGFVNILINNYDVRDSSPEFRSPCRRPLCLEPISSTTSSMRTTCASLRWHPPTMRDHEAVRRRISRGALGELAAFLDLVRGRSQSALQACWRTRSTIPLPACIRLT